jgi:hypothetical protein
MGKARARRDVPGWNKARKPGWQQTGRDKVGLSDWCSGVRMAYRPGLNGQPEGGRGVNGLKSS